MSNKSVLVCALVLAVGLSSLGCGQMSTDTRNGILVGGLLIGIGAVAFNQPADPTTTTTNTSTSTTTTGTGTSTSTSSSSTVSFSTTTSTIVTPGGITFTSQNIDHTGTFIGNIYCSLAVDSSNEAHISYYHRINEDLKYARGMIGNWAVEIVDETGDTGQYTSLALDSAEKAQISYYAPRESALAYAQQLGPFSWALTAVDHPTGVDVGYYSSIAIDKNDMIHISYYDWTNKSLKYASNKTGSWISETVDQQAPYIVGVGKYCDIALDSNNFAHISYYDEIGGQLKYATNKSGAWSVEVEDLGTPVALYTAIAVDKNNDVHISYYDAAQKKLRYIRTTLGIFGIPQIIDNTTDDVGQQSSIAVDNNNYPRISYYDATHGNLKYAYWNGLGWIINTVDNSGNVGQDTSIAVDRNNKTHIAYYDGTNFLLKYTVEQ